MFLNAFEIPPPGSFYNLNKLKRTWHRLPTILLGFFFVKFIPVCVGTQLFSSCTMLEILNCDGSKKASLLRFATKC